jgi:hypothetical protein
MPAIFRGNSVERVVKKGELANPPDHKKPKIDYSKFPETVDGKAAETLAEVEELRNTTGNVAANIRYRWQVVFFLKFVNSTNTDLEEVASVMMNQTWDAKAGGLTRAQDFSSIVHPGKRCYFDDVLNRHLYCFENGKQTMEVEYTA